MTSAADGAGPAPIFTFAGRPIPVIPGASIAGALVAAGERRLRTTRGGAPRGLHCGMGACHDCLVAIDGRPNQRACMAEARPGLAVEPQWPLPSPVAPLARRPESLAPDLLVVGGGPGGLAAAAVAAEAGLDVVLVDERRKLGGQYYKQPSDTARATALDAQALAGAALIGRMHASGVRVLAETAIIAADAPDDLHAMGSDVAYRLHPKRLVLATGASERSLPFPGWTLPGVMTVGAAQTLLRADGVIAGRRVLVGGNGPLALQVAAELVRAGAQVAALVELAPAPGLARIGAIAGMLLAAPGLVRDGLALRRTLARTGVPILHGQAVIRAEGNSTVSAAVVARIGRDGRPVPGSEQRFAVDAVAVSFGFLPQNEIARALGCRHLYDPRLGHLAVERDAAGITSVANVRVVGDAGGLRGARIAESLGLVAGGAVAAELGTGPGPALDAEIAEARRTIHRHTRFQAALWRLYAAPALRDALADDTTILCRCEEITVGAFRAHLEGAQHLGSLKRMTRLGMGRCQGRTCAVLAAEIAAAASGETIDEWSFLAPRTPFRPVALSDLALAAAPAEEAAPLPS